jgi:hypothetical protein
MYLGLNIAVTRVLMPMIEKGNAEEGKIIDMLDPPMDPLRSRIGKRQPLFTPSPGRIKKIYHHHHYDLHHYHHHDHHYHHHHYHHHYHIITNDHN